MGRSVACLEDEHHVAADLIAAMDLLEVPVGRFLEVGVRLPWALVPDQEAYVQFDVAYIHVVVLGQAYLGVVDFQAY